MSLTLDRLGEGVEQQAERTTQRRHRSAFRPDIQGLRAAAVTLVVLYHCGVGWLGGGFVGVDVFFVISGFLITGHLVSELRSTGRISLTGFYARRMRRLLPPALVVLVTTVVLARVFGPVLQAGRTTTDGFWTLGYAMNYRLAQQGIDYTLVNAAPSPLQHFWSLAVEEQFYVGWPLLLIVVGWLTTRVSALLRAGVVAALLGAIVGVSLTVSVHLTVADPPLAYYAIQSRAWELGIGALLAVGLPVLTKAPAWLAAAATWVGVGAIGWSAVVYSDHTAFPGTAALVPVLGAAFAIGGGSAHPAYGVERVLRGRLTQLVGNVSYGWYLWHWPALVLGPAVFGHRFSLLENLEISLLALWFAIMTNLLLERPMPRLRFPVRRWLPIGLSLTLVSGVVLGGLYLARPAIQGSGATAASVSFDPHRLSMLTSALKAGLSGPVPGNLQPSLSKANQDVPITSKRLCHVPFLKTEEPRDCTFGDISTKRTIVLLGDSHAEQWFGALDAVAKQLHYRLVSWTKVACGLADTTLYNRDLGRRYTECATWRHERLRAIAAMHPDLVIASQTDVLPASQYSTSRWAAATVRTLRALRKTTNHLLFISDTPHAARDIPLCLAEHLGDEGACTAPSDSGWGPGTDFHYFPERRHAVGEAATVLDIVQLDPQAWFCVGTRCPSVVGNDLVYRDDAHMTQFYSRTLAPLLLPVVRLTLRKH